MLKEKIFDDLKTAMKSQYSLKMSVLRMVLSVIKNEEIKARGKADGGKLDENDILGVIKKEARKRKEAFQIYAQNNRPELAEKELAEAEIISRYLPEEISADEIAKIARQAIEEIKPRGLKDFGKIMGAVMKQVRGRAGSEIVSAEVKKALV